VLTFYAFFRTYRNGNCGKHKIKRIRQNSKQIDLHFLLFVGFLLFVCCRILFVEMILSEVDMLIDIYTEHSVNQKYSTQYDAKDSSKLFFHSFPLSVWADFSATTDIYCIIGSSVFPFRQTDW